MLPRSRRVKSPLVCLLPLLAMSAGCGQSLPANEKTFPVHGTASMNGEAMKGGKLRFSRTDGTPFDGQAKITPEGEYSAFFYATQEGLVPGEYKVWIEGYAYQPKFIPKKYSSAANTDKTVTISDGDNALDFDFETGDGSETETEGESGESMESDESEE